MRILISGLLAAIFAGLPFADPPPVPPDRLVEQYAEAVVRGDFEGARRFWDGQEIRRCGRLGISYHGRPLKFDCTSLLFDLLPELRNGSATFRATAVDTSGEGARIECRLSYAGREYLLPYQAIRRDGRWRLTSPVSLFTTDWAGKETEFLRLHGASRTRWNRYSIARADSFVGRLAADLGIGPAELERLRDEKIDYYICDEESIRLLSGFDTHGITMLAPDAVLSRHFPHPHEVAHLLLNYSLRDASLAAPTLLQEGFAVAFGGRWERSPEVILEVGRFLVTADTTLADRMVSLEEAFADNALADISYPVAGLFVRFLIERYGMSAFLDLYRRLSRGDGIVGGRRAPAVAEVLGDDADAIRSDFLEFAEAFPSSGIDPIARKPNPYSPQWVHRAENEPTIFAYPYVHPGERSRVRCSPLSEGQSISILLKPRTMEVSASYRSLLFESHFPSAKYDGERYAIRFGPTEAGIYDYYSNELIAKFVADFRPGESLADPDGREVKFEFDPSLIAGDWNDYTAAVLCD